ncbi:MAG TPA: S8 family serine peptidase [Blastocatellia bacterium]|nr:S8 family serine peptidase [Blastocatellia bacterium]
MTVPIPRLFRRKIFLFTLVLVAGLGPAWFFSRTSGAQGQPQIQQSAIDQMNEIIALKNSLSAEQKKMDSRLVMSQFKAQGRLPASLNSLRTSVETNTNGEPKVDITVTNRTAVLKRLEELGIRDGNILAAAGNVICAYVPYDKLEQIVAMEEVVSLGEASKASTSKGLTGSAEASKSVTAPTTLRPTRAQRRQILHQRMAAALANFNVNAAAEMAEMVDNVSEGDRTHRALDARNGFGITGAGVKIGVLSDGVNTLGARQASGDLPAVTVLPGQAGVGDEGTAMLEIVHDLAPDAQLYFATAFNGITSFANNIRALRAAGCDIIVDDVIYFVESPFQDGQAASVVSPTNGGVVTQAVNDVTASGAMYFSSAGNEGNKNDGTSGTWEGNFLGNGTSGSPARAGIAHNFGDGGQSNRVTASGNTVTLHWTDPLGQSGNDYDLYIMNSTLTTVFDFSVNTQNGNDDAYERTGSTFPNERIVVVKFSGNDCYLSMRNFRGRLEQSTDGSTHGHSSAANACSVAAVNVGGTFPNSFTTANKVETFSSDGPRRLFFAPDGSLLGTGRLAGQGISRQKPDIAAADGVMTATPGFNPFFGTSAAAPHAAAMAALIKSFNPTLTAAQIKTAMNNTALDIEAAGTDRDSGAGIVMAFQALQSLGAQGIANPMPGTIASTVTSGDADAFIEPCEAAALTIPINNLGLVNATNVTATLTSATPGVVITQGTSTYPNIAGNGGTQNNATPFQFVLSCNATCGTVIQFTLTVSYAGGPSPLVVNFSLPTGGQGAPQTFSYTGSAVSIPDGTGLSGNTPGAQVFANLAVAGLPSNIADVNFRFDGTACSTAVGATTVGLNHSFVNDLEIVLKAPNGTTVKLIDNTDGSGNNFCNTSLDDESGGSSIQSVTSANAPFSGSFKPANPLSGFDGLNGNGTWMLGAQDFFGADTGSIRAFSLVLTPFDCATAPCALTAPANITTYASSAAGAVVNYPAPTTTGGCGIVTCTVPSGSVFPIGTTMVTCTSQTGASASFTVEVKPVPLTLTLDDPSVCLGAGGIVGVTATVTNPNAVAINGGYTASLPAQLIGLPGTGQASINPAGIVVNAMNVMWNGTLQPNETVTLRFKAQVAMGTPAGATLCIDSVATANGVQYAAFQACVQIKCPPLPANVRVSDQKAGSVLVFPYYTSKSATQADTRLTISNIGTEPATVHIFFIDGASCHQADQFLCLTPNASFPFKASEYDPEATGWILAVAVNAQGHPVQNNGLIGNAFVSDGDYVDNYGAESFAALNPLVATVTNDAARLFFDGQSYDPVPNQLAAEIQSPVDAVGQRIVTVGLNGDLVNSRLTGAGQVGTGLVYNGNEKPFGSFSNWLLGGCQAIATITNTTPRIPNGMAQVIPTGQAGTMKFNVGGAVGLIMTPRTAPWRGIRTLHKLSVTTSTLTIPVFAPVC